MKNQNNNRYKEDGNSDKNDSVIRYSSPLPEFEEECGHKEDASDEDEQDMLVNENFQEDNEPIKIKSANLFQNLPIPKSVLK